MNILIVIAVIYKHKSCSFTAESFISVSQMWSIEFENIINEVGGVFWYCMKSFLKVYTFSIFISFFYCPIVNMIIHAKHVVPLIHDVLFHLFAASHDNLEY